jgi:eukaryotic-like serine/threonine-protein kinase
MDGDFKVGQRVGDYEILDVLGAGGMGKVYKVKNAISERVEAMKIVLPNMAGQQERADRFLREIKLLAKLNHPNIAELRTALTLDDQLVMIMEFVDGVTLSARLKQGPIPIADVCTYADQVLSALSYAHKQNIIHRDVKPANMMLTPQGIVKLMDFGLARSSEDSTLTSTRTTMGSLYYISPEQVRGEPADARSDIYSLGVSLYEMITARPPFQAESSYSLMEAHLKTAPQPPIEMRPDLPLGLSQIILMALEKDPARRFQTADAFRNALKSVAGSVPVVSPRPDLQSTQPMAATRGEATQPLAAAAAGGATAMFGGSQAAAIPAAAGQTGQPAPTLAAVPPQPPRVAERSGSRTPYIVLGAAIVVIALVAAGLYVPRRARTHASLKGSALSQAAPPAAAPSSPPPASDNGSVRAPAQPSASSEINRPPAASNPNSVSGLPSPAPSNGSGGSASDGNVAARTLGRAGHPKSDSPDNQGTAAAEAQQGDAQQPGSQPSAQQGTPGAAPDPQLEHQMDDLTARATSVQSSIDSLKSQQAASGYGLRGDIAASDQLMQIYMSRAQNADQAGDLHSEKKYLDLAEREIGKLEKFLGH